MPGKMRAALNQFSYDVIKLRVSEAPRKICAFSEKIMINYFCVFTLASILKVGPRVNVSNAFLLNMAQLGSSGYFFAVSVNTDVKFYEVFLAAETYALIHW